MKVSVVVITYNEEDTIGVLLRSLINQTKRPDEIVIIDSKSTDKTREVIRHYQKKNKWIRLLVEKSSRARARNLGVELARHSIIAMTDAGCVADKHWLRRITDSFKIKEVEVVAGFYEMKATSSFQKALSVYLGILPSQFDSSFLPSTRSIAFRKDVWERVGGFPEYLGEAAEDTVFNYKLIENDVKIIRVKNALVEWGIPEGFKEAINKFYAYSKGDAKSKLWKYKVKLYTSHNTKVMLIYFRYLVGLVVLLFSVYWQHYTLLVVGIIIYSIFAFRKVFVHFGEIKAGLMGVVLQYVSDISVMAGFFVGTIETIKK